MYMGIERKTEFTLNIFLSLNRQDISGKVNYIYIYINRPFCVYGVVVCLPRPMVRMGRLQFSVLFTELPIPPHAAFIYNSEQYGLIFGAYGYILFFTGSPLFHFFVCIFIYLFY